uniref:SGT1 homolog, MIS12 kinetochore complex assembly cochaperone n=1 Tax=Scophthalmus maximus TaxID=52904 RepID=A0A8D3EFF8_SCOMX
METERFPDSSIDDDPQKALEALNEALQGDADKAEWFCQRAYAHILLKNYSCAADDAKKAKQLKPSLPLALMRTGIAEYYLNHYESAHEAFSQGQKLDVSDKSYEVWIKRCEEMIGDQMQNGSVNRQTPVVPPVKHDWYQTESQIIVTVMAKNVPKDGVRVIFTERELDAMIQLASGENYNFHLHLLHPIVPQQSIFKILTTKVEIKMKKTDAIRWEKLEGEGQESNIKHFDPSQSTAFRHFTLLPPALLLLSVLSSLRLSLLHLTSSFSLSLSLSLSHLTKINISACVCLFGTKTRALLEPFISLTAKVGRERVRYDSKT